MSEVRAATQYYVELTSNGKDLSQFCVSIRIVNSINNVWPIIDLTLEVDNQDIIDNDLYGQQEFELSITLTREDGDHLDPPTVMKLLYLESDLDLPAKPEVNIGAKYDDHQRRSTLFRCVPYPAFNVMTSFVNRLWEEPTAKVPLDFVKELLELRGYLSDAIIVDTGYNDYKVNQLIVPPMTMKRAMDLIDEKFAIFKGPIFRYCNYAGKFLMWDLYEKMQANKGTPTLKYIKLAAQYDSETKFWDQNKEVTANWGEVVTGHDEVETVHYPNSVIASYGHENIMITHPREDLYYLLKRGAPQVIEEQGIWHDKDETKYFDDLESRKMYFSDSVGFENEGYTADYSELPLTTRFGSAIKDMFNIRFLLKRNISLRRLMQVGEVCAVDITSEHEKLPGKNYSGAYIIGSSDIVIDKERTDNGGDNYVATAVVTAFRSVQSKD